MTVRVEAKSPLFCLITSNDVKDSPTDPLRDTAAYSSLITTTIMFRTAATKLAHNSTIPALAGNSDLKPLQEVIATEKLVLQSCVHGS